MTSNTTLSLILLLLLSGCASQPQTPPEDTPAPITSQSTDDSANAAYRQRTVKQW